MGKVIDITGRLKDRKNTITANIPSNIEVIDMTERRDAIRTHERRHVERTILNGFIGAHVIVPNRGLMRVSIYNISPNDVAFDVEADAGQFKVGEELAMRMYFNHETYFPFSVKIQRFEILGEGIIRHAGRFTDENRDAIKHFVRFLEEVSVNVRTDKGDIVVSGLGG